MKRIDQTVIGPKGNCFSACLAMMLGLDIREVPNFCDAQGFDEDPGPAFMRYAHAWLAGKGWGHITLDAPNMVFKRHHSRGYVIASGMTKRGFLHSVIYKDGELWHDPHPDHSGIDAVLEVDLIFPLNPSKFPALIEEVEKLRGENAVLKSKLNSPEILDFVSAIQREAAHQRERWGTQNDKGKSPEDWMWLIAYLSTKATQAARYKDTEKYLHHIITTAAACLNWHANAIGANTEMKPGAPEPATGEKGKEG